MNAKLLIGGFAWMALGALSVVHARGVDLPGDGLAALLTHTNVNAQMHPNRPVGDDPAPATYLDPALPFGGGGGQSVSSDPITGATPAADDDLSDDPSDPQAVEPVPARPLAPWRALLPGSIQ